MNSLNGFESIDIDREQLTNLESISDDAINANVQKWRYKVADSRLKAVPDIIVEDSEVASSIKLPAMTVSSGMEERMPANLEEQVERTEALYRKSSVASRRAPLLTTNDSLSLLCDRTKGASCTRGGA